MKLIDKLLSLISLIGVAMLMIPLSILLLANTFPSAFTVMPILAVLFTFLGYFLQSINAKLAKKKASEDGFASVREGVLDGFKIKYAALTFLILIMIAIPLTYLFDLYMNTLLENSVISYYDIIYSVFFAIVYLISSVGGAVIWFYPVSRLSNIYVVFAGSVVFYIETFFTVLISGSFGTVYSIFYIAIPFVIFNICVLLIFNQSNLQKKYSGSVVSVMTPSARLYNFFLVLMIILLFLLASVFMYVILSGISIIVKSLLFVIMYNVFRREAPESQNYDYEYYDSDEVSRKFQQNVMSPDNQYMLAVFFLLAVAVILIIIGIRTGFLQKLIQRIRQWFEDIINTYMIGRDILKKSFDESADDEVYNYKDEKKRLQKAAIRNYEQMAEDTDTYKAFLQQLGKCKSYDEQLCFAYTVLLKMYRKINISLKNSDTPREVEYKVTRTISEDRINKITSDFEKIRYAEIEPDNAEASAVLGNICEEIKRYMY